MNILRRVEPFLPPLVGGLLIVVVLIGLIGTAIRNPQPHDIPVGLVGPAPAVQQISSSFATAAPGAFQFTTYASEQDARAAIDARTVDGVLVLGAGDPQLIVAGAAGDGAVGVITAAFTNVFKAQGKAPTVETVHPFASGDAHGLILFFVVVATQISTLASQAILLATAKAVSLGLRLGFTVVFGLLVGSTAMGMATWIAGGYGDGFWAAAGLVALTSMAIGSVVGGLIRLLAAPGISLAALLMVLSLVSSGGPVGVPAPAARAKESSPPLATTSASPVLTAPPSEPSQPRPRSTRPWCSTISSPRTPSFARPSGFRSTRRSSFQVWSRGGSTGSATGSFVSSWTPGTLRPEARCSV